MQHSQPKLVGRPKGKSNLPAPIPGEPFSLLGTLRRTRGLLTVEDCATLLLCSKRVIYERINKGSIPLVNLGVDLMRVDPKAWADLLEHDNPHLKASARRSQAA